MKLLLIPTLALALFSAMAQEAVQLETIRVKGTKEGKSAEATPESVVVLRESDLPAAGSESSLGALSGLPNVEVNKNGESFSIRGINSVGVTGFQKDNLSSVIVDDLFQTDLALQAGSFWLWDLDRVEILRGAQSTSQGVNSLAGTILVDHARAAFAREGAVKVGLGSRWQRELGFRANEALLGGRLATRVAYEKDGSRGSIVNLATNNAEWGSHNRDRARAELTYALNETSTIGVDAKFHRQAQGGSYTQGEDPFARQVSEDVDFRTTTRNSQIGLRYESRVNAAWTACWHGGFKTSHQDALSDADGTSQNTAGARVERHIDRYASVEARLNYRGERVDNLVGLHVHDFRLQDDYDFDLLYPVTTTVATNVGVEQGVDRRRQVVSVFDAVTWRMGEGGAIVAGARAESVRSTYGTDVTGLRRANLGAANNARLDAYLDKISGAYGGENRRFVVLPRLGYTWGDGTHHYGLVYTRGYRTSGVSINRSRATAVEYGPEFTNNYEASYKFASGAWRLALNLFYIDWRAQQVQVQLTNDFYDSQVENAARSRVYGAELEQRVPAAYGLATTFGVGYVNTRFKDFKVRDVDYAGKQFPFAASWTARVAQEWRPTEDWALFTALRHVSPAFSNAENTRKGAAQYEWSANAQYFWADWVFELYANNILNARTLLFDGRPTSATSPYRASYHQVNAPREVGARVSYLW